MMLKRVKTCFKFCTKTSTPAIETLKKILAEDNEILFSKLTPPKIVEQLNKKVIGQSDAKEYLAIAFRNRLRRLKAPPEIRESIKPTNILMEGPTGCGKTQLCRALAAISDAPFIRVQATRYTQVGYIGKDITSIGVDLMRQATAKTKQKLQKKEKMQNQKVQNLVCQQIVNSMLGPQYKGTPLWQSKLDDVKQGHWNQRSMIIPPGSFVPDKNSILTQADQVQIMAPVAVRDIITVLKAQYQKKIREFFTKLVELQEQIIRNAEENGIVFIDQIDKLAVSPHSIQTTKGVSTQGVQRDILPLLQGTYLSTTPSQKSAKMKTNNILFIAGGSFARVKVQDLMPELLGRLPLKVNLSSINQKDLVNILRKQNGLVQQQYQLLKSQNVTLDFTSDAADEIARIAYKMNLNTENLGARRLSTMMDIIMQEYSFDAHLYSGNTVTINKDYVRSKLTKIEKGFDLRKSLI